MVKAADKLIFAIRMYDLICWRMSNLLKEAEQSELHPGL